MNAPGHELTLTVAACAAADAGRGIARLDPADLARVGAATGTLLALSGRRLTFVRAMPLPPSGRGRGVIEIDGATRGNAQTRIGEAVRLTAAEAGAIATRLVLRGPRVGAGAVGRALAGVPVRVGDTLRLRQVGGQDVALIVEAVEPRGPALIDTSTALSFAAPAEGAKPSVPGLRYEDLGGMDAVVARVREVVEWPLRHPEAFEHLGITPPRGVLLIGPPGTGKTMLARAVAAETEAQFFQISAPEIVDRFYGASEQQLRGLFERAEKQAPAIIFIDEIDAIAPRREALSGEKQVERRIVAQLLTLMDGLSRRGQVVVLAATNTPDSIDPALRRPGRFDREVRVDPPDAAGRAAILAIHARAMPLAGDVDLPGLAAATHGYVGADLASLCREAAMGAMRRVMAAGEAPAREAIETDRLAVTGPDFAAAMRSIVPTALRGWSTEVAPVRWDDVAGLDTVRAALARAVVWPLRRPDLFVELGVRPPRGVLLHGRPGTGKTFLARALATEIGANFISVHGPDLLTHWQGESERAMRDLFARARMTAPCLLFFDEIDAIAGRRGAGQGPTLDRMVAQMLTELDGIAELAGVVVLGTTNRADLIDAALLRPGRFDVVIAMPAPDAAARLAMLTVQTRDLPLDSDVDLASLAADTDGLVGADLAGLCRMAAVAALDRVLGPADVGRAAAPGEARPVVTRADFSAALSAHREGRTWQTV